VSIKSALDENKAINHQRNNSSHGMRAILGNNASLNTVVLTARKTVDSSRASANGAEQSFD